MAESSDAQNLRLSWRAVAITSFCTSIALAAVLVLVVRENNVDYLATLALALAVVTFVAQLIVFIAQTGASTQQVARAEELHGQTTQILASIVEKAEGTRQTVNYLNERVIGAAIAKALPSSGAADNEVSRDDVAKRLTNLLTRQVEAQARPDNTSGNGPELRPRARPRRSASEEPSMEELWAGSRHGARLVVPEGQELLRLSEELAACPNAMLADLDRLGRDYLRFGGAPEGAIGHGVSSLDATEQILQKGWARYVSASWTDEKQFVLTDAGTKVVAVLLVPELPNGAPDSAREARERVANERERTAESLRAYRRRRAEEAERAQSAAPST